MTITKPNKLIEIERSFLNYNGEKNGK